MADDAPAPQGGEQDAGGITFIAFVISLVHTAAHHLGDVQDPESGRRSEMNLPAAHQMIDILALLEEKTRGNLSAEERQLLEQAIYELRMRFVEVSQTAPPAAEPSRIIIP
jgi:hypothetical protein